MTLHERPIAGVIVLDIDGRVTIQEGADTLHDALRRLIVQEHCNLVLNCEGVPYIDTTGISEIIRGYTAATRRDGALKLLNLSPHVQQILTVTRLLSVFEVFTDEATAVESFRTTSV